MPLMSYTYSNLGKEQANKIAERFATLADVEGNKLLHESVNRVLDTAIDLAQLYPPERPNSSWKRGIGRWNPKTGFVYRAPYARSQSLRSSWRKSVATGNGFAVGVLYNTATYASYVMERGKQNELLHKGVWNTIEDIVDTVIGLVDQSSLGISVSRIAKTEMEFLEELIAQYLNTE